MQRTIVLVLSILAASAPPALAQRKGAGAVGSVTFAILVSDPGGAPIPDVRVTLTGPAERASRTEGGRLVFENLPAGTYHFRFDKDGFVPFENLIGRAEIIFFSIDEGTPALEVWRWPWTVRWDRIFQRVR